MASFFRRGAARVMAGSHRCTLPEVTFVMPRLVSGTHGLQHVRMKPRREALLHPMNLAGLFTWGAVALTLNYGPAEQLWQRWGVALLFLVAMMAEHWTRPRSLPLAMLLLVQAACALALIWLTPRMGVSPVLLVMLIASIATCWPPRVVIPVALVLNIAMYLILRANGNDHALMIVMIYAAFQTFAALTSHYARSAEQARDRLALVNADLLATRALLADSSRDAERLRVARELHDVAGHKLTALRLNLRALGAQEGASPQLRLAEQLSAELLGDIRGVVHALRDVEAVDIATALHALAAPFPQPRLELAMHGDVRITDPALADAVLRVVQESLTNSARHADAKTLRVTLSRDAGALRIRIEDDGRLHGAVREGNGLTGMRERIEERGGRITFARGDAGALRIDAALPA